jgi:hypothetical protein
MDGMVEVAPWASLPLRIPSCEISTALALALTGVTRVTGMVKSGRRARGIRPEAANSGRHVQRPVSSPMSKKMPMPMLRTCLMTTTSSDGAGTRDVRSSTARMRSQWTAGGFGVQRPPWVIAQSRRKVDPTLAATPTLTGV